MNSRKKGTLYLVSVGPGDPELITKKACRILEQCQVIAAPETAGGRQLALSIAEKAADLTGKEILSLSFSMSKDKKLRHKNIREQADKVCAVLEEGKEVSLVNLGDVSIYSTACYIMEEVRMRGFCTIMIPGVPSFCAVAAQLGASLTEPDQPLHIFPGTFEEPEQVLSLPGTKVLMKAGKQLPDLLHRVKEQGLLGQSSLVTDCGLPAQNIVRDLTEIPEVTGYFATVIVRGPEESEGGASGKEDSPGHDRGNGKRMR